MRNTKWAGLHESGTSTSASQRRWAALLITVRLFHRHWLRRDEERGNWRPLGENDLWFAWFPASQTKLILPWHDGKGDPSEAWKSDAGVSPKELLRCTCLTPVERQFLRQEAARLYTNGGTMPRVSWKDDVLLKRLLDEPTLLRERGTLEPKA
jgi:hypothetical protein